MRSLRTAVTAAVAAASIGFSGIALAQSSQTHTMTVELPGGGTAQIRYTGDVAPRIVLDSQPALIGAFAPMPALFGPGSPFAALDRISAAMDRQAAAMFRQADLLAAQARSGQLSEAALRNLPPGTQSYSFVSTMSGNGVCMQSLAITSQGNGAAPHVVRHSSGNCGSLPSAAGSIDLPTAPAPAARPDVVWTAAHGAHPYAGLVHEIPVAAQH